MNPLPGPGKPRPSAQTSTGRRTSATTTTDSGGGRQFRRQPHPLPKKPPPAFTAINARPNRSHEPAQSKLPSTRPVLSAEPAKRNGSNNPIYIIDDDDDDDNNGGGGGGSGSRDINSRDRSMVSNSYDRSMGSKHGGDKTRDSNRALEKSRPASNIENLQSFNDNQTRRDFGHEQGDNGEDGTPGDNDVNTSSLTRPRPQSQPQSRRGKPRLAFENDGHKTPPSSTSGQQQAPMRSPPPMPMRPRDTRSPCGDDDAEEDEVKGSREFAQSDKLVLPRASDKTRLLQQHPSVAPRLPNDRRADYFPWTGQQPEDRLSEHVIKHGYYDKMATATTTTVTGTATASTQGEHHSARHALLPMLKHKSGLRTLSSIFAATVCHRRARGRVTAASTFKPPPRVTLTDTKRESWLRDLSNPRIPLRRLSRTIPHGIRGRALLDQCIAKQIPVPRAVWLAKCVGANEMRAFKRKGLGGAGVGGVGVGVGGEAKWVRDWTLFVEQFLDSIVEKCGQPGWGPRMEYALRLSAQLLSEQLIDREHHFEWLNQSLEQSSTDLLPVWLLLTEVHRQEMTRYRKSGRLLVSILSEKLHTLSAPESKEALAPLNSRLVDVLVDMMRSGPQNFTSPSIAPEHRKTLASYVAEMPTRQENASLLIHALQDDIFKRARRISPESRLPVLKRSTALRLYDLLDAASSPSAAALDVEQLSRRCLAHFGRHEAATGAAVRGVIEWATSAYRSGVHRIYLAARLIRKWNSSGIDTDGVILSILPSIGARDARIRSKINMLLSELVRSRRFSVGRYLQWLIARGSSDQENAPEIQFLAEMPLANLPQQTINLRRTLLASVGRATHEEEVILLEEAKRKLCKCAPQLFRQFDVQDQDMALSESVADACAAAEGISPLLTKSVQSELARWIRNCVAQHVTKSDAVGPSNWRDLTLEAGISAITPAEFAVARSALEHMQDLSMLADVLRIVASSDQPQVLASVADTLSYQRESFAAIGALRHCFDLLLQRFFALKMRQPPERALIVALADLASRVPDSGEGVTAERLHEELREADQRCAAAASASSPVSDHVTDLLQHPADSDFCDEMEQLLSSGTSMDAPTLRRLFGIISSRLESSWDDQNQSQQQQQQMTNRGFCLLLSRLRSFDATGFDELMAIWCRDTLQALTRRRATLAQITSPLIVAGCLTVRTLVDCIESTLDRAVDADCDQRCKSDVALQALQLFAFDRTFDSGNDNDEYRLRLQRHLFAQENPIRIVSLMRRAIINISSPSNSTDTSREELDDHDNNEDERRNAVYEKILCSDFFQSALRLAILDHLDEVRQQFLYPLCRASAGVSATLGKILDALLLLDGPEEDEGGDRQRYEAQMRQLLCICDELSMAFCQLKLQSLFEPSASLYHDKSGNINSNEKRGKAADEDGRKQGALVEAIFSAYEQMATERRDYFLHLISVLSADAISLMHEHATYLVLDALISDRALSSSSSSSSGDNNNNNNDSNALNCNPLLRNESAIKTYLFIARITASGITRSAAAQTIPTLVDRLEGFVQMFSSCVAVNTATSTTKSASAPASAVETSRLEAEKSKERSNNSYANELAFRQGLKIWFHMLLQLVMIYGEAIVNPDTSATDQARIITPLCLILPELDLILDGDYKTFYHNNGQVYSDDGKVYRNNNNNNNGRVNRAGDDDDDVRTLAKAGDGDGNEDEDDRQAGVEEENNNNNNNNDDNEDDNDDEDDEDINDGDLRNLAFDFTAWLLDKSRNEARTLCTKHLHHLHQQHQLHLQRRQQHQLQHQQYQLQQQQQQQQQLQLQQQQQQQHQQRYTHHHRRQSVKITPGYNNSSSGGSSGAGTLSTINALGAPSTSTTANNNNNNEGGTTFSDITLHYLLGNQNQDQDPEKAGGTLMLSLRGARYPFTLRTWEILAEPAPIVGENDTSLSLTLFRARKILKP